MTIIKEDSCKVVTGGIMVLARLRSSSFVLIIVLCMVGLVFAQEYNPRESGEVANLQKEVSVIQAQIKEAEGLNEAYAGGLIKSLIAVRLEILRSTEALLKQRIHAIKAGVKVNYVANVTKPDPNKAAKLAKEVEVQKGKLADVKAEANRYSGGLLKVLHLTNAATVSNSLAMLEQKYFMAKYGLFMPMPPKISGQNFGKETSVVIKKEATSAKVSQQSEKPASCLEIDTFDSSVLDSNSIYVELAWKVDVKNSCDRKFAVRVTFTIYDKDDFELDSDNESIPIPPNGTGKARGKMLISPPAKAHRMSRQGVSLSLY